MSFFEVLFFVPVVCVIIYAIFLWAGLLVSFIRSFLSGSDYDISDENCKEMSDYLDKIDPPKNSAVANKIMDSGLAGTVPEEAKQTVELFLDTGKIVFPEDMSQDIKEELEQALKDVQESFKDLSEEDLAKMADFAENFMKEHKDEFISLEDFLSKGGKPPKFNIWDSLTNVNDAENALAKVSEEMEFCDENTEHWNDADFAEALYDFERQGYDFNGIDDLYKKIAEKVELSQEESRKLKDWYKLASQENVYGA